MQKILEKFKKIKKYFIDIFADISGWKKDFKKISRISLAVLIVLGVYAGVMKIKTHLSWGLHFNAPVEWVKYKSYSADDLDLSFSYPDKYIFDANEKKKYSTDYLAGFYLKADQRTGCDVRATNIGINFSKSDQEIKNSIFKSLSANVKGLADFSGKRIEIDNEPAMQVSFLLVDPLGNTLRIIQTMVSHNNQSYLLICGAGQSHYWIYEKDFDDFISRIYWK